MLLPKEQTGERTLHKESLFMEGSFFAFGDLEPFISLRLKRNASISFGFFTFPLSPDGSRAGKGAGNQNLTVLFRFRRTCRRKRMKAYTIQSVFYFPKRPLKKGV